MKKGIFTPLKKGRRIYELQHLNNMIARGYFLGDPWCMMVYDLTPLAKVAIACHLPKGLVDRTGRYLCHGQ